jgi:hypothetical protein
VVVAEVLVSLLTVTFATSTSLLFPAALEIAAQAAEFTNEPVGKIKRYRAMDGATPAQAELAVALLQHLDNIKGVLVTGKAHGQQYPSPCKAPIATPDM